jgi:LysR family hydrogen peroxide-inducible transcriptional activator
VQKLEELLGVKIFDRSRQPVVATDIGAEIIARARVLLSEKDKIREMISDRQKELSGELKIGIIPTVSLYILPDVIRNFITQYPQVKLSVWELTTDEIIRQLRLGMIDCGVLSTPLNENSLLEIPVFYERFIVYAAPGSKLRELEEVSAAEIDAEEIWVLNEGHCMRNQALNICQRHRSTESFRHFEYFTGSVETLKRMVDVNSGATILPELSLSQMDEDQHSGVRHFRTPAPSREISIVIHRNFLKRRLIEALRIQLLRVVPGDMLSRNGKEIVSI